MDNRTSSSLSSPIRDAASDAHNHYLQALRNASDNEARDGGAALAEIFGPISDEQTTLSVPTNPAPPPLRFSHKKVDRFMYSLSRTDTSSLAEDDKLCEICFLCFGEWRWEDRYTVNAGDSGPFKVLVDMMPENPVRLSCGHIFGELCLRTWMMRIPKGPLKCPKCRTKFSRVGRVKKLET